MLLSLCVCPDLDCCAALGEDGGHHSTWTAVSTRLRRLSAIVVDELVAEGDQQGLHMEYIFANDLL